MKVQAGDFAQVRYFRSTEIPGWWELEREVLFRADRMRALFGFPLRVTSAVRSVQENLDAGGVPESRHLTGEALDLGLLEGQGTLLGAYLAAEAAGFRGIGVYHPQSYVHVDVRPARARWAKYGGADVNPGDLLAAISPTGPHGSLRVPARAGFDLGGTEVAALLALLGVAWAADWLFAHKNPP